MDDGGRLDNITVSIRVTDVDEAGMIDVSAEAPELGSELMAAVMDPDGDVTSISLAMGTLRGSNGLDFH